MNHKGFSLVEVVVGSAVLGVVFVSLISTYGTYIRASAQNASTIKTTYLIEEGIEAVKTMRDRGWTANINSLTVNTPYYFDFTSSFWKSTTTAEIIDVSYRRSFVLAPVYRDGNSDIVTSGGTLDADAKKVSVTVVFSTGTTTASTTKTMSAYLTNIFKN